ncbi:pilus assembly protein PilZ [Thalassotalea sp. M1531]|uniref:Pilus assembly protein PilZ n=1 Tax=Thalassotalea algicola TaxID=2716224 RepID=A0A7Y0LC84_9GAMM|nr:PilZ domain-containing protein [Thalassotalea algicola]NMP31422.1 pilus assembly protein PilZ [Thalassotalea algicola]
MNNLYLEFITERDLYQSYMPFLKHGGLFVRTPEYFELGAEVTLDVLLPDSLEKSSVKGEVCWLTPVGAQNGTPPGVGVSFIEDNENVRGQIEKMIARHLNSSEPTLTM